MIIRIEIDVNMLQMGRCMMTVLNTKYIAEENSGVM